MGKLRDGFGREIDYLRIAVTDRCNLRCQYCVPSGQRFDFSHDPMGCEEIQQIVHAASELGIRKVRLTGGEPLVRPDIIDLVKAIARIAGIEEVSMTTNGVLLAEYATALARAGLKRVNVSLDSLRSTTFARITGANALRRVLDGIRGAQEAGLVPLKINTVVMRSINDEELSDLAHLTLENAWQVRFIELMPVGEDKRSREFYIDHFIPAFEVRQRLMELIPTPEVTGNGPATYFRLQGGMGNIGFISPVSSPCCHECNRIRLTARGILKPCLFSEQDVDLRSALQAGADSTIIKSLIRLTINGKPKRHYLETGVPLAGRAMLEVGG